MKAKKKNKSKPKYIHNELYHQDDGNLFALGSNMQVSVPENWNQFQTPSLNLPTQLQEVNVPVKQNFFQSMNTKLGGVSGAMNKASGIVGGISGIVSAGQKNAQIKDTSDIQNNINANANTDFSPLKSNSDVLNAWGSFDPLNTVNYKDLLQSKGSAAVNTLSGAASGAAAGAAFGPIGCVCAGTRVITNKGKFVNIEDLHKEEGIIGWNNKDKSYIQQSIYAFTPPHKKPCVEITLDKGITLRCSIDHPILYTPEGRAPRQYINSVRTRIKQYKYIDAECLKPGDNVAAIKEIPVFGDKEIKEAYLLGLLIGDGTYGYNHPVRLFSADENTWDYIEDNNIGVLLNEYKDWKERGYNKEFRAYRIINGPSILRKFGIYGQTKLNKRLPDNIHEFDKQSLCNLIAGLIDTDGFVSFNEDKKDYKIAFTQSNIELIKQVKEQLLKLGIHTFIKVNNAGVYKFNNSEGTNKESYTLAIHDNRSALLFSKLISLNIDYKRENLIAVRNYLNNHTAQEHSDYTGIVSYKVKDIKFIGEHFVYNLQADDSHTYIANGIITHNSIIGGVAGLFSGIFGRAKAKRKAKRRANALNMQINAANNRNIWGLTDAAERADTMNDQLIESNFAAYGGNLNNDTMDLFNSTNNTNNNLFAKGGGIHINPKNKGKLTATAKRTGKSFSELAHSKNPLTRKRAIFALNARKWRHDDGGFLNNPFAFGGELGTNSADFTSGLTEINEGGTHEQNPNDGVQMGTDEEGTPNLVEQGETVFNDYVFSNRLKVPDKVAQILKIKKGMTYADASKYLNKEVNERPNDPLSKGAQESLLSQLAMAQEMQRNAEDKSSNNTANQHADGGNLFETGGDKVKPTTGNTKSYDYYQNKGKHQPVLERIKKGWSTFLGPNGEWLYNPDTGMYADEYLDPGFINYVKNNPKEVFNYFNKMNTPGYFIAGNTAAPTMDQLIGTISNPGLMYDRNYGEAHNFGAYMLSKYLAQKNKNNNKKEDKQQTNNWTPPVLPTWMRYAPVAGSMLNVLAGLGQRPDYSNADLVANTNISPALVGANHIGNYLSYNPFDTQYYINQAQASNRATQRAIQNNSNGNRAMANAALLANDYNFNNNLGNLARQAAESNFAQRTQVEGFNRATNQYNADADTRAALANQAAINQARQLGLNRALQVANLRQQARDQYNNIAGANLTRLFQGLGDIGWENFNMNMINSNRALRYGTQTNGVSQYKGSSTKSRGGRLMK